MKNETITDQDLNYYCSVNVLCAGGTINMTGCSECKPAEGVKQALEKINNKLSSMSIRVNYESLFVRPPDSSNVGEKEWAIIIERIAEVVRKKEDIRKKLLASGVKHEVGGIVIAHGTDTLHITSLVVALEFSIRTLTIPIIFTASHSTIDAKGSDASDNLLKSIYCAKERFSRSENLAPGVYVLIGQDIHLASRLTKVYTMPNGDGKYFFSFPSPVGQITSVKSESFHYKIDRNYLSGLTNSSFSNHAELRNNKPWGIVEHIFLDKFASVRVLEDLERRIFHYRSQPSTQGRAIGVVIQGDFKNNSVFNEIATVLHRINDDNVIILIGSRQTYIELNQQMSWISLGLIPKSLSHLKAKIKLGWLLKSDLSTSRVLHLMGVNIAGEIFPTDILPEWIRFETFHSYSPHKEVVIAYPNIHFKVLEDAVNRLLTTDSPTSEQKQLYLYGFGDGHFPAANASIATITKAFIKQHWNSELSIDDNSTLSSIFSELNSFVKNNSQQVASYFEENYNVCSEEMLKLKLRTYINRDIKAQKREEVSKKIQIMFIDLAESNDVKLTITRTGLEEISRTAISVLKFHIDEKAMEEAIEKIFSNIEDDISPVRRVFLALAAHFPDVISRRILKEAVMASNNNMSIIGAAVDSNIKVVAKSLAVRSKSDLSRYEIGNMLMVLGVDSDSVVGYRNEFFIKKPGK